MEDNCSQRYGVPNMSTLCWVCVVRLGIVKMEASSTNRK